MSRHLMGYVAIASTLALSLVAGSLCFISEVSARTQGEAGKEDCLVTPLDFADLTLIASTPAPTPQLVEFDSPASAEISQGIAETVAQAVACANANDLLRSLALFTDRYLAERFGADHPDDLGSIEATLSRTPVPAEDEDVLTVVNIEDEMSNGSDWARATVTTTNRDRQFVDRLVFERVGDQWLIDSLTPTEIPTGTPTA